MNRRRVLTVGVSLRAGDAGSACSATHFGLVKVETKPGDLVTDNFQGEHATAFLVKDRGLVIITSCGHAGVMAVHRELPSKLIMPSWAPGWSSAPRLIEGGPF